MEGDVAHLSPALPAWRCCLPAGCDLLVLGVVEWQRCQGEVDVAPHRVVIGAAVVEARQDGRGESDEEGLQTVRDVQTLLLKDARQSPWQRCGRAEPYVAEDGDVCDGLHDGEPDADVLSPLHHRAAVFSHKLLRVQADLDPVVDEREERREGTGHHEDGDEAKLNDYHDKRD